MKYDSDEKLIKKALSTIHTPEYNIKSEVEDKIKSKRPKIYLKKTKTVVLAVSLIFILSIGVAAATIPSFNNLLSMVSPDIGLLLQPIGVISEDNGIKVEVVAAMNDDESTKTATLRMQANGGKKLNGKKVSFHIGSFLSDKMIFNKVDTKIDLSNIIKTNTPQVTPLDMNNIPGAGGNSYKELKSRGIINVLKPDEMNISIPNIDFMYVSNIGYIEDNLHIQTKWVGDGIDDHGFLYFVDALGNKVNNYSASVTFGIDELGNTDYGHDYIEYIFDMNDINLDEIKLMGDFVSNNKYIEGNWKTTFKLQSVKEEKQISSNIKLDTLTINKVSVSPIGITLLCSGNIEELQKVNIKANMVDGTVKTFESSISYGDIRETKLKFISPLPLDVSNVKSLSIGETVINLKN